MTTRDDAIAAIDAYATDSAQLARVDQAAKDQAEIDAAQQAADNATAQTATVQAEFDAYRASHPNTTTAKVLTVGATVGANDVRNTTWGVKGGTPAAFAKSIAVAVAAIGKPLGKGIKCFGNTGIAKADTMWRQGADKSPRPLLTDEQYTKAALSTYLDTAVEEFDYCIKQEFMDKMQPVASGGFTANQFVTWLWEIHDLLVAHPNGHLARLRVVGNEAVERQRAASGQTPIWQLVMAAQTPNGRKGLPPGVILGNDTYITVVKNLDPAVGMKGSKDWFDAARKIDPTCDLGISECGISRVAFTPDQRAKGMTDYVNYCAQIGAIRIQFWCSDNTNEGPDHDYAVDKTGDGPAAAALAGLIGDRPTAA